MGTRKEFGKCLGKDIGILLEIRLGNKEKEKLKNKLIKGDKKVIKDPTTRLLGFISTIGQLKSLFLLFNL